LRDCGAPENIYGNFYPLIMLQLTVGYGAAALAGQDEDGTLALVTALPIRRRSILLQKAGAMAAQAVLLAAAVAICVIIGRGFHLSVSPAGTVAVSVAVVMMGLDFGLIAMAAGVVTGPARHRARRRRWPGSGLLSAQLAGLDDLWYPARPVSVTVPLVGGQRSDQPRGERRRLRCLACGWPVCPGGRGCRLQTGRSRLTPGGRQ
jgi:ABC-2 family transporter protein